MVTSSNTELEEGHPVLGFAKTRTTVVLFDNSSLDKPEIKVALRGFPEFETTEPGPFKIRQSKDS